ncbi:MAG: putative glyoxalase superfamily protein PhnB [Halioglobus sp.]|jgi:uncharacterized glyoxalase superfamily protein PhnB
MDLNQVTLASNNIPDSIAFYKGLGLILIVEDVHYARFELPTGNATLSVHLTGDTGPSHTVIYFEVENVSATFQNLSAAGIQFTQQPTEQPWLWYEARLEDPYGNPICIYTAGDNRRNPPWRLPLVEIS